MNSRGRVSGKVAVRETVEEFGTIFRRGAGGLVGNEKDEFLRGFEEKHAVEGDQVSVVADEAKIVAPGLVEAHAPRGQLVGSSELGRPHSVARFCFENAVAVEFAAAQQSQCRRSSDLA